MKALVGKTLYGLCIFALLTLSSCKSNWVGDYIYGSWSSPGFILKNNLIVPYIKHDFSINNNRINNLKNTKNIKIDLKAISYFNAEQKKRNRFEIKEKDLNLVNQVSEVINSEISKLTFVDSKSNELFFLLDSTFVNHGISSFRSDLIKHKDLIKQIPTNAGEVNMVVLVAEVSSSVIKSSINFQNSTSVQMLIFDNKQILYSNAVVILNTYRTIEPFSISHLKEDLPIALSFLLEDLENNIANFD